MKKSIRIFLIFCLIITIISFAGCTFNLNLPEKSNAEQSSSSSKENSDKSSRSTVEVLPESSQPSEPSPNNDLGKPSYEYNDIPKVAEGMYISFNEAYETFFELTSAENLYEVELDEEDGQLIWEIEGIIDTEKYKVKISAVTGEVLKNEKSIAEFPKNYKTFTVSNVIAPEVAIAIAQAKKFGEIDSLDLDFHEGALMYEIELRVSGDDWDFTIDAQSGEIVKMNH